MRRNGFNETYAHTAAEAQQLIDDCGDDVYVPGAIEPPTDGDKATAEIAECVTGDLVCYVEADTAAAVKAILDDIGVEVA